MMTDTVKSKLGHPDQYSKPGPNFREKKYIRVDRYSWNFGPLDQNFRRTKISVTVPLHNRY